jgi:hypothetical protein
MIAVRARQQEDAMTGSRFASWTRRGFGTALAGITGLGLLDHLDTEGKKHKKRRKKRKKRCLKVQASCVAGGKKNCCSGLLCDEVVDLSGTFCCRPENAGCVDDEDCCFPTACFFDGVIRFCKPF